MKLYWQNQQFSSNNKTNMDAYRTRRDIMTIYHVEAYYTTFYASTHGVSFLASDKELHASHRYPMI